MRIPPPVIADELEIFDSRFKEAVQSPVPMLNRITSFIVKRKGKQMRPMFVLLTAKVAGGITDATYRAASLVELVHTASLVHDDVVDESMERRGFFSTYALWKAKASVLIGDYLLTRGLHISLASKDFRVLQYLSDAVQRMSEGELLQMEKARTLNLEEGIYFDIIRNKTASLLAAACATGAFSSTESEEIAEKMRLFGEKIGIAFQIKDDLFDYGSAAVGKPTGNDIKEKKLTLPIIYTLNKADKATRRQLINTLKNDNRNTEKVKAVIQTVVKSGGIAYAEEKMNQYRDEALAILKDFPESESSRALEELVRYTTDRKY
ncbi:MAG: polyprenyl synthetase family protein [Bacteroidetes bacterium]|nr:polyprenyl synthetase family protein [Bacteroidota bacterium]HOA37680.1 polyprenyl synthetase family protein [Flavihumibacter sp.]